MKTYGPAMSFDYLADTKAGSQFDTSTAINLTPPFSFTAYGIGLFIIGTTKPEYVTKGYSGGTGGSVLLLCNGRIVGEIPAPIPVYAVTQFRKPLSFTAGQTTTIQILNADKDSAKNFFALDSAYSEAPQVQFAQNWLSLGTPDGRWTTREKYTPIFVLYDANAKPIWGNSWFETEYMPTHPISKEVMTPKVDLLVKAIHFKQATPIIEGIQSYAEGWTRMDYKFPVPHKANVPFEIIFPCSMLPMRKGTPQWNHDSFPDGHAEFPLPNGTWGEIPGVKCDLQFWMELV